MDFRSSILSGGCGEVDPSGPPSNTFTLSQQLPHHTQWCGLVPTQLRAMAPPLLGVRQHCSFSKEGFGVLGTVLRGKYPGPKQTKENNKLTNS